MRADRRRSLHSLLCVAAIGCSGGSLYALFGLQASSWTTPLNVLAVTLILLAARTRAHRFGAGDG